MSLTIVISYRRQDSAGWAGRIYDRLVEHFGESAVFIDIDKIRPGDDFAERILDTINSADVFVALIGPDYLATPAGSNEPRLFAENDYVRLEVGTALETGTRVIPVLVDGATMPAPSDLPEPIRALASKHAHEVSPTRFRADVDQLITALDELTEEGAFGQAGSAAAGIEVEPLSPPKTSVHVPASPLGAGEDVPSIPSGLALTDAPEIRYARTDDGLNIAYWTLGAGQPLLLLSGLSHAEAGWELDEQRHWLEQLAAHYQVVHVDFRGRGLSDWSDVAAYGPDDLWLDVEAVVGDVGFAEFSILANGAAARYAVAFAQDHADRVSHLVLWAPNPGEPSGRFRAVMAARDLDIDVARRAFIQEILGADSGDTGRRLREFTEKNDEPLDPLVGPAIRKFDATPLLPNLSTPTLVLAHADSRLFPNVRSVRGVAAAIPGARLVSIPGTTGLISHGDTRPILRALESFLGPADRSD